jgi:hypothetical protein
MATSAIAQNGDLKNQDITVNTITAKSIMSNSIILVDKDNVMRAQINLVNNEPQLVMYKNNGDKAITVGLEKDISSIAFYSKVLIPENQTTHEIKTVEIIADQKDVRVTLTKKVSVIQSEIGIRDDTPVMELMNGPSFGAFVMRLDKGGPWFVAHEIKSGKHFGIGWWDGEAGFFGFDKDHRSIFFSGTGKTEKPSTMYMDADMQQHFGIPNHEKPTVTVEEIPSR